MERKNPENIRNFKSENENYFSLGKFAFFKGLRYECEKIQHLNHEQGALVEFRLN